MSVETARIFLDEWVIDNVPADACKDEMVAKRLAMHCLEDAKEQGITKAELEEAAGEDLVTCMMDAQVATSEVKNDAGN